MIRLTDRPAMTIAVVLGRKAKNQQPTLDISLGQISLSANENTCSVKVCLKGKQPEQHMNAEP